jgi:uncharacterized membrane protein
MIMITLIAAAVAAAAPAVPAQSADAHAQHQQGQAAEHKGMDCCKDGRCPCCKDMSRHDAHGADDAGHQQ